MTTENQDQADLNLSADLESIISQDPLLQELPRDYQAVIDHILFHKALISDEEDGERLNDYIELINDLKYGTHVAIKDPYDKCISIMFQLAITEKYDPWEIDLVKFSEKYVKRIQEDEELDLVTAGRIIFMAWSILKKQSDKVLADAERIDEEEDLDWLGSMGDWMTDDMDFNYTMAIKNSPSPPLQEMVWRKGERPVTLLELVGAFEEARKEAEVLKVLDEQRRLQRERDKRIYRARINQNMHKEDLEADIQLIYERICEFNGHPIPFSELCDGEPEIAITTLISSLYLANRRKINIWQLEFPHGKILIENLEGKRDRAPPLPGEPAEDSFFYQRGPRGPRVKEPEGVLAQHEEIIEKMKEVEKDIKKPKKPGDKKKKKLPIDEIMTSKKRIAS